MKNETKKNTAMSKQISFFYGQKIIKESVAAGMMVLLCAGLFFFACSRQESPAILAEVGERPITQAQFDAYLKVKRIKAETPEKRSRIIDEYLQREALADAVEKSGLLDKALVAAEINEFRKQMLISRYFEKFLNTAVTDQAVQNYYNTHPEEFEEKKVHVAHILIRVNPKMSEAQRQAKLTLAHEARSKAQAGEDFGAIAEAYSEDRLSAKKGGDLGWIREGSIDPVFSRQVFSMKPGDISQPFETPFGFHVVKMLEGPRIIRKPFEAVAGNIRYRLRNQAKAAEIKRLMEQITIKKVSS